jgi:cysteinyl-tRNA synthetase
MEPIFEAKYIAIKWESKEKPISIEESMDTIPIEIENSNTDIKNAANNFNFLVQKINRSIQYSYKSIEHTSQSLKQIENSIEEFLILLNTMDENRDIDIQMTKKEDAVIQSLEELMNVTAALDNLQSDLENLYQPKTKLKN